MRNPGGYGVWTGPGGVERECDTITCSHCQRVIFIKPGHMPAADPELSAGDPAHDLGGLCRVCMKHICGPCAKEGTCIPFEKKIEKQESDDYRRRQNARVMGL